MVFEPLGIGANQFGTLGCFQILEVDNRFPAGLHTQRVTIAFGKAIHEIHSGIQVLHPKDGILIECLQVTVLIELNHLFDNCLLRIVFGYSLGLFQPIDNLVDSLSIQAARLPYLFLYLSVFLHQTAIHTEHHRHGIVRILHLAIEFFGFLLSHAIVIIGCRCQYKVLTIGLVDTLGHELRIENYREDFLAEFVQGLSFCQRKLLGIHTFQRRLQEFRRKARHKLVGCIMMVNTVREPYTLEVGFHIHEVSIGTVSLIIGINRFEHLTDNQIVLAVLVEQDVTALQSSLGQIVDQLLLLQGQFFESMHLVTEQLQIGKLLYRIVKRIGY